ncbi:MAG: hypothetical protein FWE92_03890 [Defluviitaleaceae bacterium]|nr:hypothetical protein [Defluviitaleaceae bacterium]
MSGYFEKFMTKDKMKATNVAIAILFGIALIVSANLFPRPSGQNAEDSNTAAQTPQPQYNAVQAQAQRQAMRPAAATHEEMLERRLESILRTVDGVGNVRVMITLAARSHRVYAENVVKSESSVSETDSAGGRREQSDVSGQQTTMTITRDGNQEPVLIREYEPIVEGVIISAQGAGDARVRDELGAAARVVLGLEAHQVQVLRMISGGR